MKLQQLLTPERIAVGVRTNDWRDAIRAAGRLLVDTGMVEERYIDGMIRTAAELGPYIVIAPGLAIPHSRPEDGVIEPCMAVVILTPPIPFGHEENDPVEALIAFGTIDNEQHIEALSQVADILSVPENLEALKTAQTVQDVTDIMFRATNDA